MGEDDRRLHNMPKTLASKCVEAFISWGHDHKGNPAAYKQFLRTNLPHYPGVDAEKVRLYMKNICATYHERYIPARARGYKQDFLVWWEKRPGRGRPKKDVSVPSAYALAHHLDPSLAPTRYRGGGIPQSESGAGRGFAANKFRDRRTPAKRAKAFKARGGSSHDEIRLKSGGGRGGGGGGRGNSDDDSEDDNEVYYYGSDFEEIEEEEEDNDGEVMAEDNYDRRQQKNKGAVQGFSKSGRAIRRPSDPYLKAVQEETTKRARIEAALAMIEMDDNNGRALGRGPPPPGVRTPSPPLFNTHHGASVYPVRHQGRSVLRIESPVPLTDRDVTDILTDLRSSRFARSINSNGDHAGSGGCQASSNSKSDHNHTGATKTITNGDIKTPDPAVAVISTPSARSLHPRPLVAPRTIRTGDYPSSAHTSPQSCAQALAGLVNLGGVRRLGHVTSPLTNFGGINPPTHARPHQHHYIVHPSPHPDAAVKQMHLASPADAAGAAAGVAATTLPSVSPMQFLAGSSRSPLQHPGERLCAHGYSHQHNAYPHANMNIHRTTCPPVFHQHMYQLQFHDCQDPRCTGCPAPTFLNSPLPRRPPPLLLPATHPLQYRGDKSKGADHRRH